MTERTQPHDHIRQPLVMSGDHVSVELPLIDDILSTKDTADYGYRPLYNLDEANGLSDQLHPPLKRLQSGYFFTDEGLNFDGLVDFSPEVFVDEEAQLNWLPTTVIHLQEELEASGLVCKSQLYSPHAVTIQVDGEDGPRIRLKATVSQDDLCRISMATISGHSELSREANADLLRQFIHAFITSIDSVMQLHSRTPATDLLHLTPYQPSSLSQCDANLESTTEHFEDLAPNLDQLGGLANVKQKLSLIAAAFKHPEAARLYDVQPTSFLLYGPAGTGKTSLVRAFAAESGATLLEVDSSQIFDKWIGNSGKAISKIFNQARSSDTPTVIFLDEFDSLNGDHSDERRDVKNLLKKELSSLPAHVIVAAATNEDSHDFDEALVRSGRFEKIYVPLPDESERTDIWAAVLSEALLARRMTLESDESSFVPYDFGAIDYANLAHKTEGMTGADFKEILRRARGKHFLAHVATLDIDLRAAEYPVVTQADIEREIDLFGR